MIIDISFNLFIESDIEKSYIGLLGTIVLFVILSYLFITEKIILMDFYTGLAISIVLAILGLLSWTIKSEIEKFSEKRKKFVELNIEKVQKEIGKPNRIDNGIQQYESRDDLPKFKELIAIATETVDMSGLSFTLMILQHSNVIKKALKKGRNFTFLILDVNSKEVDKYSQTLENANDLKNHINSTLEILCELKKELKDKDNLTIKTYDSFQRHGIIIIDKDKENALVKVEKYDFDNPSNRQNKIAYKVDNPDFYESSLNAYNELLEKSTDYNC